MEVYMEMQYVPIKSLVITLPEERKRVEQLKMKLEEYKGRISTMGTICKKTILERLLKDGKISTWEIAEEMIKKYGSDFNAGKFNNACAVILDYCTTGGENTVRGTGLPHIY